MTSSISSDGTQTHFMWCGNHCGRDTEMRLMLPRWNATVLTLLHHSHCGSAPSPCPTQARSLLRHICSASPSISQPCRTRWQHHTQHQALSCLETSVPLPPSALCSGVAPWASRAPPREIQQLKAAQAIRYLKTSVIWEMRIFSLVLGDQCEFLGRGKMQQIYLKVFLIFWIQ